MKGKIVSVDHLGFDEASRIEGDWGRFSDNELSELSQGKSASSIRSELENGDIALIVDSPSSPLLLREGQGFSVSKSNAPLLSESGAKKIGHRFSGNYSGGTVAKTGGVLHPPKLMPKYIPEPVVKNQNDKSQPFYEYCFEVACSEKAFFANIGCDFLLSKTESESQIGKWEVSLSDNGVKYKALICINEHKGFVIQTNSIPMGISIPKKITPRHIGSNVIKDSYIPIMPAIQVGEHLGFPTEGYFYHFNDEQLIQEYKILGEGKCGFFGTKSRQGYLNNEREYNRDQGAFLVFGLINGEMSENQFIFYREEQLTLSELSEINEQWLRQNGIKLDINAIIEAKTFPVIQRPLLPQEKKEEETVHIVQVDPETNKREMWPTIAGKYGLSANELLEINSHFKADPMALKVGDKLQIKKTVKKVKEVVTETPLEAPQAYNQPLNTYYRYTDRFLPDTTVKTINSESLVDPEITIVNVSQNSDSWKLGSFNDVRDSVSDVIDDAIGAVKQVGNDLIASQRAMLAEHLVDNGVVQVTDTATGKILSPDEVAKRYGETETFEMSDSEKGGANAIKSIPAYGSVLLAAETVGTKGKNVANDLDKFSVGISKHKNIDLGEFNLDEVLAHPELDAVKPVKIDPASMLADDIESLMKEGKEFVKNPTLAGAASMAVIAIPGKYADNIVDALPLKKIADELPLKKLDKSMAKYLHTMKRFKVPCFEPGPTIKGKFKGKERELESHFARQLKNQEAGLNDLTVGEYIKNRNRYKKMKRTGTGMAQEDFRKTFSDELKESLNDSYLDRMSPIEADMRATARTKEIMDDLAALHDPDMIAGGADKVTRMGNKRVNSSIGSQWRGQSRLAQMDKQAQRALETLGPDAKMNVSVERCPLRGSK